MDCQLQDRLDYWLAQADIGGPSFQAEDALRLAGQILWAVQRACDDLRVSSAVVEPFVRAAETLEELERGDIG
jgi:hypothetical protein